MSAAGDALPATLVERVRMLYGEHAAGVLTSFEQPKAVGVRVNPLVPPPEIEDAWQLEPYPGVEHTFVAPPAARAALLAAPAVSRGALYLQNPSSWLAVAALDPEPNMEVCDLAAAPGGKASHIAALMANTPRLAAVEPIRPRFHRLRANLERLGVSNAAYYRRDGRSVGRSVPGRFARILLDAPCSSEARMRADDPGTFAHWSPAKVRECARKQRGLLRSAWQALAPGGVLVYATCSFAVEENEAVVNALLRRVGEACALEPVPTGAARATSGLTEWAGRRFDPRVSAARRIIPDAVHDGMFIARLRKPA